RPLAPAPAKSCSITATSTPPRRNSSAADRPVYPPPITTTSARASPRSGSVRSGGTSTHGLIGRKFVCSSTPAASSAHPPRSSIRCSVANHDQVGAFVLRRWLEDRLEHDDVVGSDVELKCAAGPAARDQPGPQGVDRRIDEVHRRARPELMRSRDVLFAV